MANGFVMVVLICCHYSSLCAVFNRYEYEVSAFGCFLESIAKVGR